MTASSPTLPTPIPAVSGWQLVDWIDKEYTSDTPAAGGITTITLPQLDYNIRWQLTHVVIGCNSTTATSMRFYLDTAANSRLRDGSITGNFDVADWAMGLMVPPSRGLLAQWSGCSAGATAWLNLQANVYRLAGT
jgi:hypothetical protein